MSDPGIIDALSKRLAASLPSGLQVLGEDLRRNLHSGLEAALGRMELVRRDEFDAQSAVLGRTRAQLDALEEKLKELEELVKHLESGRTD